MTKRAMRVPTPSQPDYPEGIALLHPEKAEVLSDNLETQFQPVTDSSVPAVIEMVDVGLRSYCMAPASEPKLNKPKEVQEAIRGRKVDMAQGPNGNPKRALKKKLSQRAVSLLALIFEAIFLTHNFPTKWKHARVISTANGELSSTSIILSAH